MCFCFGICFYIIENGLKWDAPLKIILLRIKDNVFLVFVSVFYLLAE